MINIKVTGTGSYLPKNVITNDDLSKVVDTNDEWIRTRTGIKERRISEGENTITMATNAAKEALKDSNLDSKDIDLIIVATLTPDNFMPSTACSVQNNIGALNAMSFDISAACSGFIYGLEVASSLLNFSSRKRALVIGAETLSKILNWEDRGTCVLFGDGAGACVIEKGDKGIEAFHTHSIGEKGDNLTCGAYDVQNPYISIKNQVNEKYIKMNGREIFKFAVKSISDTVRELIKKTSWELDDIKYIVPHQANVRIIDYTAKRLNIDNDKFYTNLDKYGNTSAASIAIALDEMNKKKLLNKGDQIILVGFGGGLTYGGAALCWNG